MSFLMIQGLQPGTYTGHTHRGIEGKNRQSEHFGSFFFILALIGLASLRRKFSKEFYLEERTIRKNAFSKKNSFWTQLRDLKDVVAHKGQQDFCFMTLKAAAYNTFFSE